MTQSDRPWTLITVTYNSVDALERFWRSGAPDGTRWIIVDNGSSDATVETARALGAEVVALQKNVGFGAANNIGFRMCNSPYACFLNPDVTIDPDSLERLRVEADLSNGIVAPQLLNWDGSLQANGRGYPLLLSKVLHRLAPGSTYVRKQYIRTATAGQTLPACWVMGAAVAARRETFEALGAWDERFFLYYEDKDLCLRAWGAGFPVHVVGSIRWVHGWARETTRIQWAPWRREIESMVKFYARYPEFLLWPSMAGRRHPRIDRALRMEEPAS